MVLALQLVLPGAALAEQREVELDNHTQETDQASLVSDIRIDGVDKPAPGVSLDVTAAVSTAEGSTWEIPVLWVRDDLQIESDVTVDGHSYLPVLAFFVPRDYRLEGDAYTVTLSDSLTELFGTAEIISVYNASTGITYILPASLRDLFAQAREEEAVASTATDVRFDAAAEQYLPQTSDRKNLIDIYCAQTARDALTDEDLAWLIELILDYLEPQAVELLLDSFPAFREAANNGEIGREIGLYIYYLKGDKDGNDDHDTPAEALAYVSGGAKNVDGEVKYCYMIGVDVDSLLVKDDEGNPIRDPATGKYKIARDGEGMISFENTVVHELFHAIMDDYNRTGMSGATNLADVLVDSSGNFVNPDKADRYGALHFPNWFIEGSASATENIYQFRNDIFQILRRKKGADGKYGTGELNSAFSVQDIFDNYLYAKYGDGEDVYFDLEIGEINDDMSDKTASRYVAGYLATLYLSDLAARYNQGRSAIQTESGTTVVDAAVLRDGLNSLLKWMHEGATLDDLIVALSPKDTSGVPVYANTESFTKRFIKGELTNKGYQGDADSLDFVEKYLNYLLALDNELPEDKHPNGSILFDFDQYYNTPLESEKKSSSDFLCIVENNTAVTSTVKGSEAKIGGGKSDPDQATTAGKTSDVENLPIAAKAKATDVKSVDSASTGASAADDAIDTEDAAQTSCDQGATAPEPLSEPEPAAAPESVSEPEPAVAPEDVSEPEVAQEPVAETPAVDGASADDVASDVPDSAIDEHNDFTEGANEA